MNENEKKIDIYELRDTTYKNKGVFNVLPIKNCAFILKEFRKPLYRKTYHDTEYIFYECKFLDVDGKKQPYGKHSIQLPVKTAWMQLFEFLEEKNLLKKKNIYLKYTKINQYNYKWNVGD